MWFVKFFEEFSILSDKKRELYGEEMLGVFGGWDILILCDIYIKILCRVKMVNFFKKCIYFWVIVNRWMFCDKR